MNRRRLSWLLWLIAAGCLYFFENGTGTRVIFAASVMVPLLSLVCALWCADRTKLNLSAPHVIRRGETFSCRVKASGPFLLAGCLPVCGICIRNNETGETFSGPLAAVDPQNEFQIICEQSGNLVISLAGAAVEDRFGLFSFPISDPEENTIMIKDPAPISGGLPVTGNDPDTGNSPSVQTDPSSCCGVREYVPGDPVRLIHWKLTAKTDRVLIRENEADESDPGNISADPSAGGSASDLTQEANKSSLTVLPVRSERKDLVRKRVRSLLTGILAASVFILCLVPQFRYGAADLLNRLFAASEAANAYRYEHFAVPAERSVTAAVILLSAVVFSLLGIIILNRDPLMILAAAAFTAAGQAYFGLTMPVPVNLSLFMLFGVLLMRGRRSFRSLAFAVTAVFITAIFVIFRYPGTDPWVESRSEHVRDLLAIRTAVETGSDLEGIDRPKETRHVNSRTLVTGEDEANVQKAFRLVTEDEEQISLPEWADTLGGILPAVILAAAVAVVVFLLIRVLVRRKRAADERKRFTSGNTAEAVCAMFEHVICWLDSFGFGSGNLPFREWPASLSQNLPEAYVRDYAACVQVFEEACYSEHQPEKSGQEEVRRLLDETESLLYARADWKKRLKLKYMECLYR